MPRKHNAVARSLRPTQPPHPSRTSAIRHWYLEQISADDPAVAMLHIAVTAGGQVNARSLGLDHVHATIVLDQLDRVRQQIEAYVDQAPTNNVIPIRP